MTDGIRAGWDITGDILGLLIGLLPILALAAVVLIVVRELPHRIRVARYQRQQKRSGRTTRSS